MKRLKKRSKRREANTEDIALQCTQRLFLAVKRGGGWTTVVALAAPSGPDHSLLSPKDQGVGSHPLKPESNIILNYSYVRGVLLYIIRLQFLYFVEHPLLVVPS